MNEKAKIYTDAVEVEAVVSNFESCLTAPTEFHHREHLIVAMCYLLEEAEESKALERMRASLLRFLAHHRLQGVYHETITLFWLKRVHHFLRNTDIQRPLPLMVNDLIETCADPKLIYAYFSQELLSTAEAKQRWVMPDIQELVTM